MTHYETVVENRVGRSIYKINDRELNDVDLNVVNRSMYTHGTPLKPRMLQLDKQCQKKTITI